MYKNAYFLVFLFSFIFAIHVVAQPNYPAPRGVWCSCPPTTGNGTGSVLPEVAAKDYVQGILVRVVWRDLEPVNDTYNWTLIDNQIAAAQTYGKKISLAVGGGPNSPDWLYEAGASSLSYTLPFAGTIPLIWDEVFLTHWTDLIASLGARYEQDTTIQLVYLTNATSNGFEMQLPFRPTPDYETIGYTDMRVIDAWKRIIDAFELAFPNHYLTNDFHPVNESDVVADSVYQYASRTIGSRYGANAWWWTQNNTSVYPAQYEILQHSATNRSFSGLQMAGSGVETPERFGEGGMPEALRLAIEKEICYWEVWNKDIVDGSFDSLLMNASCELISSVSDPMATTLQLEVYPNPSQGVFHLQLARSELGALTLIDQWGRTVFSLTRLEGQDLQLDLSAYPAGWYYISVTDENGHSAVARVLVKR